MQAHDELLDIPFNRAYCSSAERCVDTANIVLEGRDVKMIYTKGLKEMNFGTYEGTKIENHLEEIDARRFGTYDWSDVGGEDKSALRKRVLEVYQKIYDEADDGDKILIVSHGAIFYHMIDILFGYDIDYYLEIIKNGPAEHMPIPNGYAAHFARTGDKYDIIKLQKRDESILKTLRERK